MLDAKKAVSPPLYLVLHKLTQLYLRCAVYLISAPIIKPSQKLMI